MIELEDRALFRDGVNINVSFSYEINRWDMQLIAEAIITTEQGTEDVKRSSNSIDIDRICLLYPGSESREALEKEVETEIVTVWFSLMRTVQKRLEKQGILMDSESFHVYVQERTARQKRRNEAWEKKRLEELEKQDGR